MGLTIAHATAIVVPVVAGFILNFVGYRIPFFVACGVAVIAFFVTLRLDPAKQRCPARIAADEESAAARARGCRRGHEPGGLRTCWSFSRRPSSAGADGASS